MRANILKTLPVALTLLFATGAYAQVKIGVAGPITGANAAFGAQLSQGVGQAVEDINKAGGILGKKLELEAADGAADPQQGVSVCNKVVSAAVTFLVWPFNSGVT